MFATNPVAPQNRTHHFQAPKSFKTLPLSEGAQNSRQGVSKVTSGAEAPASCSSPSPTFASFSLRLPGAVPRAPALPELRPPVPSAPGRLHATLATHQIPIRAPNLAI